MKIEDADAQNRIVFAIPEMESVQTFFATVANASFTMRPDSV